MNSHSQRLLPEHTDEDGGDDEKNNVRDKNNGNDDERRRKRRRTPSRHQGLQTEAKLGVQRRVELEVREWLAKKQKEPSRKIVRTWSRIQKLLHFVPGMLFCPRQQ